MNTKHLPLKVLTLTGLMMLTLIPQVKLSSVLANSKLPSQLEQPRQILRANSNVLLAALKIRNPRKLKSLRLADPNSIKVGQSVYAIGTPFETEFRNTYTSGIVSRIDRKRGFIWC